MRMTSEASGVLGRPFIGVQGLKDVMVDVGLGDVHAQRFKWPTNPWAGQPKYEELGRVLVRGELRGPLGGNYHGALHQRAGLEQRQDPLACDASAQGSSRLEYPRLLLPVSGPSLIADDRCADVVSFKMVHLRTGAGWKVRRRSCGRPAGLANRR